MKAMISHALKEQIGFPTPPKIGDNRAIRISQKELQSKEAMMNQPSRKDDDVKSTTSTTLSLKHWPRLDEKSVPDKSEPESQYEPSDLMAFSQLSVTRTQTKPATETENQLSEQINAMNLASGHYAEVQPPVPGRFFGQEAVQFYRAYDPNWDANKRLNPYTGKYECCGGEFEDVKRLAEHLILHMGRNFT